MVELISNILQGVPFGCVYALLAVGLVLTYKTSGVFNIAFGAQAYLSAVAFASAVAHGFPTWIAFILSVVLMGPVVGFILDRLLFRHTRSAPPLVKLVPALGLLLGLPSLADIAFGTGDRLNPPWILFSAERVYLREGSFFVNGSELSTTLATVVVVGTLAFLLSRGGIGLSMRAVVESHHMAELAGIDAKFVGSFAWMLSSTLAGLAGVLLAPINHQVDSTDFNALLVVAIAAAAIGRFQSLPITLAGGVLLGIGEELIAAYAPVSGGISVGLRAAFPFTVLAALLIFDPIHRRRDVPDPLSGVDPPSGLVFGRRDLVSASSTAGVRSVSSIGGGQVLPIDSEATSMGDEASKGSLDISVPKLEFASGDLEKSSVAVAIPAPGTKGEEAGHIGGIGATLTRFNFSPAGIGTALLAVGVMAAATAGIGNWQFTVTQGIILGVIFLSITLLTGISGQISLCQASFAGVGAFTAGQLALHLNTSVMAGIFIGGAIAAVVGGVLAITTLGLGGIPLALLTLSFALLADNMLFPLYWVGNGASGLTVPRPTVGSVDFEAGRPFLWLAVAFFVLCGLIVGLVRGGTVGQQLAAASGSEVAAVSVGVNIRRLRITVFALAAGIAGIGGGLYGSLQQTISKNDFNYQLSLVFVVVVATVGVRTVAGAIQAGLAFTILQQAVDNLPTRYAPLAALIFGIAALSYVRQPQGIVAYGRQLTSEVIDRFELGFRGGVR